MITHFKTQFPIITAYSHNMTMTGVFLASVFLLCSIIRYVVCVESYWEEYSLLRNNLPVSEVTVMFETSLFACLIYCSSTDGCCLASYIDTSSVCRLYRNVDKYKTQNSSSVWTVWKDDGCPCGWYRFKTSCFLFADVNLTWEDSRVYCQLHYGHLAEVDTEAEDAFIRSVVLTIPDLDRVWLGGSDLIKEDEWIWNTSDLVISSYSNWDDGQPDNSGDQGSADCLCMRQWADFLWTDTECTAAGMPICETRYHKRI